MFDHFAYPYSDIMKSKCLIHPLFLISLALLPVFPLLMSFVFTNYKSTNDIKQRSYLSYVQAKTQTSDTIHTVRQNHRQDRDTAICFFLSGQVTQYSTTTHALYGRTATYCIEVKAEGVIHFYNIENCYFRDHSR